jgi:hypothetical protein
MIRGAVMGGQNYGTTFSAVGLEPAALEGEKKWRSYSN